MQPKSIQTTGDSPAVLVRAADLSLVFQRLDGISEVLKSMQETLPLRRRKVSAATRRAHIGCVFQRFGGRCPCCREVRIVDEDCRPLPSCNEEHFVNRHENAIDKTWLVCQDCNQRKTNGKILHADVEALFRAYQVTLRKHLSEAGPYQMKMLDSAGSGGCRKL